MVPIFLSAIMAADALSKMGMLLKSASSMSSSKVPFFTVISELYAPALNTGRDMAFPTAYTTIKARATLKTIFTPFVPPEKLYLRFLKLMELTSL